MESPTARTEVLVLKNSPSLIASSFIIASLGSYTASIIILNCTKRDNRIISHQIRHLFWAGLSLGLGFWACQPAGVTLDSLGEHNTDTNLLFPETTSLALSLCLPFLLIVSGFLIFDYRSKEKKVWMWTLSGSIIGLAVELINYIPFTTAPYSNLTVQASCLTLSLLLSVNASILWITVLALLKHNCISLSWPRILASIILGATTTGANCLLKAGISFAAEELAASQQSVPDAPFRKIAALGIPLSVVFFHSCSLIFFVCPRSTNASSSRSPKVLIASVIMTSCGRILVDESETLPCEAMCLNDLPDTIIDELDIKKDAFQWLLTLSYKWSIFGSQPPGISFISGRVHREHWSLRQCLRSGFLNTSPETQLTTQQRLKSRLYETVTRLAKKLQMTPQDLGVLHADVLETEPQISLTEFLQLSKNAAAESSDIEEALNANENSGRVLFFVRELSDRPTSLPAPPPGAAPAIPPTPFARRMSTNGIDGASWPRDYGAKGYKLRTVRRVRDSIADKLGARQSDVSRILGGCQDHISSASKPILDPGAIYVSLFTERYREDGSAEVLVYDFAKHQIPSWRLDIRRLNAQMRDWVRLRAGTSTSDLYDMCKDSSSDQSGHPGMIGFLDALASALERLMDDLAFLGFEVVSRARLNPYVVNVPTTSGDGELAQMIVLNSQLNEAKEASSDATHTSGSGNNVASGSSQPNIMRMPSVFAYTPRSLFDILHSLVCSPSVRNAISSEPTTEPGHALGNKSTNKPTNFLNRFSRSSRAHSGLWDQERGRRPPALVSSFSVDSVSIDGDNTDRMNTGGHVVERVRETLMALKERTLLLAPRLRRARSVSRVTIVRASSNSSAASSITLTEARTPSPPLPSYSVTLATRSAVELCPVKDAIVIQTAAESVAKRPNLGRGRSATALAIGTFEHAHIPRESCESAVDVPFDLPLKDVTTVVTKPSRTDTDGSRLKVPIANSTNPSATRGGYNAVEPRMRTVSESAPLTSSHAKRTAIASASSNQVTYAQARSLVPAVIEPAHIHRNRSMKTSGALPPLAPPPRRSLPPIPPTPRLLPPVPPSPPRPPLKPSATHSTHNTNSRSRAETAGFGNGMTNNGSGPNSRSTTSTNTTPASATTRMAVSIGNRRSWIQLRPAARSVPDLPDRRR